MGRLSPLPRRLWIDPCVAAALGLGYVGLLLATASSLGYARDEGFYFAAAESYGRWFELLGKAPNEALQRGAIDAAFGVNREHPVLAKGLFALSWLAQRRWHVFAEEGTSFRFPGMCFGGLTVALCYLWGARVRGRVAGLAAALAFALVPTTFYHAHLDCFDVPITAMWLLVAYCYHRSLTAAGAGWALLTGVTFGLALDTKHNSWFLPIAFVVHAALSQGRALCRGVLVGKISIPTALLAMATVGPAVFIALWPYVWYETAARLAAYVQFHTGHDYYNIEFLGQTYFKPPFPRSYAWLMTAATVPMTTLWLAALGGAVAARERLWPALLRLLGRRAPAGPEDPGSALLLWTLGVIVNYGPWLSTGTPIFGGTKHWMAAYPFLALIAGVGFDWAYRRLREASEGRAPAAAVALGLGAVTAAPALVETLRAHPWGLSACTPLVGGMPGAATLGLNRGFWGYTTGSVVDVLNEKVPRGGSVFVHDTAYEAFKMLQRDGRLRADIRPAFTLTGVDAAVYHHEQHMAGVEQQIWVALGTTTPTAVRGLDQVPIVWVYTRP